MKRASGWVCIALLAVCAACGGDEGESSQDLCDNGQPRNTVTGECGEGSDTGTRDPSSDDAGNEDGGQSEGDTSDTGDADAVEHDTSGQEGGTLQGVVTRKASASPEEDGVGDLYIAVFGEDPIANPDTDQLVGFQRIEDADVAAETAEVAYRIEGIVPRDEAYYVTAFLDDDATAEDSEPSEAGPDAGDLVAVENFFPPSSPQVTVDQAAEVEFDILLNFNMF